MTERSVPVPARFEGMTARAAQVRSRQLLTAADVPEPALEAALLLGHVLHLDRAGLLLHATETLGRMEAAEFAALLARRLRREPVAYLIGVKSWYGIDLQVDRNVLIPRPETEILAALAVAETNSNVVAGGETPLVLDVGTGSGALAIAVGRGCPQARVLAIDIGEGALRTARQNCERLAPGRVVLERSDLLPPDQQVHIIIANLPYIPTAELAGLEPELAYEPRLALDGGPTGLSLIEPLLRQAAFALRPGGVLLLECHHDQGKRIAGIASTVLPGCSVSPHSDLAGIARFVRVVARVK